MFDNENEKQQPSIIVNQNVLDELGKKTEEEIIDTLHKVAVVQEIQNNEETQQEIVQQAKKSIKNRLKEIDNDNNGKAQKSSYNANQEACKAYGIENNVPVWQVRLMRFGHSIWFIIYWLFATITICPINVFVKGLKAFIKNTWLVIILAVLCYLLITFGIPFLIARLGIQPQPTEPIA